MPIRNAHAAWSGNLQNGEGKMKFGSGAFEGNFSAESRFEDGAGTNPEELIGAAHAGCFSMAFSNELDQAGYTPKKVETNARVTLEEEGITGINLTVEATVADIDESEFLEIANSAKENCPVSQALKGVDIALDASLI